MPFFRSAAWAGHEEEGPPMEKRSSRTQYRLLLISWYEPAKRPYQRVGIVIQVQIVAGLFFEEIRIFWELGKCLAVSSLLLLTE